MRQLKNNCNLFFILFYLVILFSGCSKKTVVNSLEDYNKWLGNKENGLLKIKKVNGFELKVKLLPANYLAYKEYLDLESTKGQKQLDSLIELNKTSLTFLFTLSPDHEKGNSEDIILSGVTSEQEYNEKANTMSFNMDKYISLKSGEHDHSPVLYNMENIFGLNQGRNILFVFSEPSGFKTDKGYDFRYTDELFKLGINHFLFNEKDLNNTPEVKL